MSVLSVGLLLPFGAGAFSDRAIALVTDAAGQAPTKHVYLTRGSIREALDSRCATVAELLAERGIVPRPDDRLSSSPDAPLSDGMAIEYQPALAATLVVDGSERPIRTIAATVADVLALEHISVRPHDRVSPALGTVITPDAKITVTHTTSWLERVRTRIARPVARKFDPAMARGTQRVIASGTDGAKETTVAVLAPDPAAAPTRTFLAARILRRPQTRIIAVGVGQAGTLAGVARRGFTGTLRLADAALQMVATAYTAGCSGCSGVTASGRPAGPGVVAVDPRVIPLGTHLFIPGYGHAFAGDTGGAIRGNRIDLGFATHRDALTFGRRAIVVYVLK